MGEIVEFPSNGSTASGYLSLPSGTGPGVIVIQEWWGLVGHIKDVADRFASEGFVALAPDLYHGKTTKEPDEATKLMMSLQLEQATKDMSGAYDFLAGHASVSPKKVGCVGFCMGGAMTLTLATIKPIAAAVPFYGIPAEADYPKIAGAVQGHFAEHDDWASPKAAEELFANLREMGKTAEMHVYPGTDHAFFNDDRPEVYKSGAAKQAWERSLQFFRTHLA